MYSLIDNLVFPAPKPTYTHEELKDQIIYIPKFRDYNTHHIEYIKKEHAAAKEKTSVVSRSIKELNSNSSINDSDAFDRIDELINNSNGSSDIVKSPENTSEKD